ncbi:MAG: Coenzyme F420 hydrogenase/dehydrogenase, beta subunit C-terminal domain [Candidatus Methanospirareceae archaeon]
MEERGNITDLEGKVIYNGLCCYCGACGAFCKEYITYEDDTPKTKEKCYEIYGACYDFCPRTFFAPFYVEREIFGAVREDNALGFYRGEIVTARAKEESITKRAQDGGVVTALLGFLLDKGEIDAAVVAKRTDGWKTEPFVATTKEEIIEAAGSKYTQCPSVLGLGDAFREGKSKVALVGLPCHIQAARKMQLSKNFDVGMDRMKLTIGLFCTETFDYELLVKKVADLGVKMEDVEKFNIKKGNFIIYAKGQEIKTPIKEMRPYMREACKYCVDFAAEFADISVGSIGSELGWSTVICRSKEGEEIMKEAEEKGVIEVKKLSDGDIESVRKLAVRKKKENLKNIYEKAEAVKVLNLMIEPEMLKKLTEFG